jgi:hypothetical protein
LFSVIYINLSISTKSDLGSRALDKCIGQAWSDAGKNRWAQSTIASIYVHFVVGFQD